MREPGESAAPATVAHAGAPSLGRSPAPHSQTGSRPPARAEGALIESHVVHARSTCEGYTCGERPEEGLGRILLASRDAAFQGSGHQGTGPGGEEVPGPDLLQLKAAQARQAPRSNGRPKRPWEARAGRRSPSSREGRAGCPEPDQFHDSGQDPTPQKTENVSKSQDMVGPLLDVYAKGRLFAAS